MASSVILTSVLAVVIGRCICDNATPENSDKTAPRDGLEAPKIFDALYKTLLTCADREAVSCLRKRAVSLMERASSVDNLPVWGDTVVLVKSVGNVTAFDVDTDRSFGESLVDFFDSRRIQLRLPRLSYFFPASEGRKKKDKGYGMMAMSIAGAMMAMGMAALAAMAGKALAASMAAMMLALMAAMRKGGGGGGGHHGEHSSYEVISIPAHHHHRSLSEEQHLNSPYYKYDDEQHHVHEKRR